MTGVTADSVIVEIEARNIAKFERDFKRAADTAEREMARIRKSVSNSVSIGVGGSSGLEKEAQAVERASARKVVAAKREAETEEDKSRRISAAVDRGIAARERDATSAERAAERIAKAGSRSTAANQTRLMSGTSLSAVTPMPATQDNVNYLIRDQIDLRAKLGAAIAAGESKAVTALNDELTLLRLIGQYKRAGLTETDAATRAEQGLAAVVKARANMEANAAAEQAANAAKGVAGTGRVANGYRNLGRQIADVGTSVAGGMNPFLIVAQQAPQVADALTDTGGKAAKVASFFAGPWGAALLAAGSVLGVLGSKLFETGDSVESLTKKLEDDAQKSDLSRRAQEAYSTTLTAVAESIKELNKALDDQANSYRTTAERAQQAAEKSLSLAKARRAEAAATLETVEAELRANLARSRQGGERSDVAAMGLSGDLAAVQNARARLGTADQAIANAEAAITKSKAQQASEFLLFTTEQKINREYDRRVQVKTRELVARKANEAQIRKEIGAIEDSRKADLKAAKDREQAAKAKPGPSAVGRTVDVAGATAIINGIGGRVTSGYRSTETQARIYADKLAGRHAGPVAKPGTSDHERGQAIDVAYGPGISVASIQKAFRDAGVRIRQILPEPQQRVFHVAFGKAGKSAEAIATQTKRAADRQTRDDEAFSNENEQLRQQQIDALRSQTTDISTLAQYARDDIASASRKRLTQIDADEATGKYSKVQADENRALTRGVALLETVNVNLDERAKLQAENNEKARALLANQEDELTASLQGVESRKLRYAIEDKITKLRYEQLRKEQDNIINSVDPKTTFADRIAAGERKNVIDAQERGDARQTALDRETPYQKYRKNLDSADSLSDDIDNIKIEVLDKVADSLAEATKNALGLHGALGDIVGQIIKIGIQRKLIGPLADGLFGKADGTSAGGLGGFISGLGNLFGGARASGGNVSAGQIYRINENGPEYFQPAMSGKIIPTGRAMGGGSGGVTITQNISVDGRNSVTPASFASDILGRANQYAAQAAARAGQSAYQSSPQRQQKLQQLGS